MLRIRSLKQSICLIVAILVVVSSATGSGQTSKHGKHNPQIIPRTENGDSVASTTRTLHWPIDRHSLLTREQSLYSFRHSCRPGQWSRRKRSRKSRKERW